MNTAYDIEEIEKSMSSFVEGEEVFLPTLGKKGKIVGIDLRDLEFIVEVEGTERLYDHFEVEKLSMR